MGTLLYFQQGATERRSWVIDGTDDLTGASARFTAKAGGQVVLSINPALVPASRTISMEVSPATSRAWSLAGWGSEVSDLDGATVISGYRAEWQMELTLADGTVWRVDEGRLVVSPELAAP